MNVYETDAEFEVICKRCEERFWVIRNWGGGLRRRDNNAPAKCNCGSLKFELY